MKYTGYSARARMFEPDGTRQDTDKVITPTVHRNDVPIFGGTCSYNIPLRKIAPVPPEEQKQVTKPVANVPETVDDKVGFWTPTSQFE